MEAALATQMRRSSPPPVAPPVVLAEKSPMRASPHVYEFTIEYVLLPGDDFGAEFDFGLEMVLDRFERTRDAG